MQETETPPSDAPNTRANSESSDVDETLLAWTLSLSSFERLDASYRAGLALDQFRALSDAG